MNRRKPKSNWTDTGSFANRPRNGWIHPDEQLNSDAGITFQLRFMGSISVFESMKSLNFDTRTALAKECIYRICSAVYPKASFRKSKQPSCLMFTQRSLNDNHLADQPDLQFAETDVNFTISVDNLSVIREDNGNLLYHHRMQTVSFASEGDGELNDFVAYIAKDDNGRKCHVLECQGGLANEVITTIGQAFEIRFKKHLVKKSSPETFSSSFEQDDMRSPLLSAEASAADWPSAHAVPPRQSPLPIADSRSRPTVFNFNNAAGNLDDSTNHIRVGSVLYTKPFKPCNNLLDLQETDVMKSESMAQPPSNLQPYDELWFHGKISRQEAEKRLHLHGDFLVRESPTSHGQFVLSGLHNRDFKHLLLVDPEGRVRTKDQLFTSVSHLINYHLFNTVPIVAIDCEMLLMFPVCRPDVPG